MTIGSKSQEQAVANAAYAVELAQGKLNDAIRWYGADSDKAAAAQATLALAQSDLAAAQIALQVAVANQENAVADAGAALADAQASYAYVTNYRPPSADVALAEAQVAAAESALAESQTLVAALQGEPTPDAAEPTTLAAARAQVAQAALAVEAARLTLNNTVLVAPISGTITAVNASAGEAVGTTPIVTLAALDELLVRFYVEENDLGKVAAGYPVSVIFDAAPDVPVAGEVMRVDPALVSIDGSPAVQAWARLDAPEGVLSLVSGLSAEI
ncbi:MAG TPA: HlyD family efflux transporter periplasmic adaptor subunit, partial [Anaerolineales bacterium]|nr:HlyD family efflux transporter periplasmic adaptor subunit [Anaerolineales bacterium]